MYSVSVEEIQQTVARSNSPSNFPIEDTINEYLKEEKSPKVVDYLKEFFRVNECCGNDLVSADCKSLFHIVSMLDKSPSQSQAARPHKKVLRGHDELRQHLKETNVHNLKFHAIIAESICPHSICLLGMEFGVRPKYWATHFEKSYHTREEDVDPWLASLPSRQEDRHDHSLNIQYLEPRQLICDPRLSQSTDFIQTVSRPLTNSQKFDVAKASDLRVSQGANRDVQILPARSKTGTPVAFIPGPLSVWSTTMGCSEFMVILIDPQPPDLKVKPNFHLDRASNESHRSEEELRVLTPTERVANALLSDSLGKDHAYRGIGRLISKQWQLVQGYMSWDLHRIQLMLRDIPNFDVAEGMLKDLFTHRQNCTEFIKMLDETVVELRERKFDENNMVVRDLRMLQEDLGQLSVEIEKNVSLLTGLTSIREARQARHGLEENHSVKALTQIAIIYLPFSTVAAVLSMPGSYAPGENLFWVYCVASIVLGGKPRGSPFGGLGRRLSRDVDVYVSGRSSEDRWGLCVLKYLLSSHVAMPHTISALPGSSSGKKAR
ncbi:hypothetical protein GGS23DRAFT_341329 [Durotheca rogersii]|uniref:uncharacterized protein n=1 Tax=Durotheca rogersii TaxID=419775 RepID=UPI00221FEC55|nr:uncharacterized protein GGS23DRAFT_341329 [Durotheca rogersii]KAI5857424.1 hypothetical protein GGS23DRAFT_341329 [Durotheca rogersii]